MNRMSTVGVGFPYSEMTAALPTVSASAWTTPP
jgi:hypothetical protein